MRRCILGTFLLLAACGGGVRDSRSGVAADQRAAAPGAAVDARVERANFAFAPEGQEALRTYGQLYGEDAVNSCFSAWIDEAGAPGLHEPVAKPDARGLRSFLCACVGATHCL